MSKKKLSRIEDILRTLDIMANCWFLVSVREYGKNWNQSSFSELKKLLEEELNFLVLQSQKV